MKFRQTFFQKRFYFVEGCLSSEVSDIFSPGVLWRPRRDENAGTRLCNWGRGNFFCHVSKIYYRWLTNQKVGIDFGLLPKQSISSEFCRFVCFWPRKPRKASNGLKDEWEWLRTFWTNSPWAQKRYVYVLGYAWKRKISGIFGALSVHKQ